jgi:hypothetical protein
MKQINDSKQKEKSVSTANQNTFHANQFDVLAGHSNGFTVSNIAENAEKLQCESCNPTMHKPSGDLKLCADCETKTEQAAIGFFSNFRRHRKIVRLDCYCFACCSPKSAAMMSKRLPICRTCASEVQSKGVIAQSNFIARTLNNFHKKLREVAI